MDWLTDGFDSIIETLKDWIITALEYTVFAVLYYLEIALAWILSLVEDLLEIFTGEKEVLYAGDSTALVNVFFNHSSVRTIYTAIGLIGIVFAFAFAIVAVIRKILDLRGKQQGVTLGSILGNLLKSILLIGGMNAIVLVALTTTNVLVKQVSYSFTHSHQLAKPKAITFDDEEYAAMGRILNTIGNYSVNPSYRSRYNLNACYNDIRTDLKYLGGRGVFDYHYVNEKDADGNELVTWQNLMEFLGTAYNYNREVTLNSYDEALTDAILDAMEILRVNPTLEVLSEYKNPSVDMEKGENLSLDRMLVMLGTMGSVNGAAAARNDAYNDHPSLFDNVRLPFYTGEKSIYDYYGDIIDVFYTDPYHMNYLIVYVVTFGLIMEMIVLVLNCAVRIFNLVALYVIAPLAISSIPLDDGGKFKQWTTAFTIQLLSVVGTVISIRLFFVFLPVIWSPELTIGGNAFVDGFVKCLLMYASISAVNKVNGIFTGILADNAGYQAVMAGDMKQEFEGSALGRVLGKATGRMKSFGLDKLADKMEGRGGGGGSSEKKEVDGGKKQPDPKKVQAASAKQAAQNRKDYNKLKADYAHAQKTGHHATGSGKKLKAGELDKKGKTLKHMEQGKSLKDATKLAEKDMKQEKQQQKQADAAEKRKNQTPPPDRNKAKKAAEKMNKNDYERMKSDYNFAKENGSHLTNGKDLKNGELEQMKETLDQYDSMHANDSGSAAPDSGSSSSGGDSGSGSSSGSGETPQSEKGAGVQSDSGSSGGSENSSGGSSESASGGSSSESGSSSGGETPQSEKDAGVQSDSGSSSSDSSGSGSSSGSTGSASGGSNSESGSSSSGGETPQSEKGAGVQSDSGSSGSADSGSSASGSSSGSTESASGASSSESGNSSSGGETPQSEKGAGVQSDSGSSGSADSGSTGSADSGSSASGSSSGSTGSASGGSSSESGSSSSGGETPQSEKGAGVQSDSGSSGSADSGSSASGGSSTGSGSSASGSSGAVPTNEGSAGVESSSTGSSASESSSTGSSASGSGSSTSANSASGSSTSGNSGAVPTNEGSGGVQSSSTGSGSSASGSSASGSSTSGSSTSGNSGAVPSNEGSTGVQSSSTGSGSSASESSSTGSSTIFSKEKSDELTAIYVGGGQIALDRKIDFLNQDPKLCRAVAKGIIDGTLTKDLSLSFDAGKGKCIVTGFPGEKEFQTYAANAEFLKKTDAALKRLETGSYKNEKDFIRDSAYAVIGQMYRATDGAMLKGAGEHVTLDAFMEKQLKDKTFAASLKSKNNPKKYIPPKEVARMAKNEMQMRQTGERYIQGAHRAAAPEAAPARQVQEKQAKRTPKKVQKDDRNRSPIAPK